MRYTLWVLLLGLSSGVASADTGVGIGFSIGRPAPVVVRRAPPSHRGEPMGGSPGPGFVWIPGHYIWASRWIWIAGTWVQPPRPDVVWVNGTWNPPTNQWMDAHWEAMTPPPATVSAPDVVVTVEPPPPVVETRVAAPGPDFVWISGYWDWAGGRHVWIGGRWERPPQGAHAWTEPRWEKRGGSYVFVRGVWR